MLGIVVEIQVLGLTAYALHFVDSSSTATAIFNRKALKPVGCVQIVRWVVEQFGFPNQKHKSSHEGLD